MITKYPMDLLEFVRDNSRGVPNWKMAEMVNEKFGTQFSETGMKQFRQRHGIKSGLTGWYEKGHVPFNKGLKQEAFISPEAMENVKKNRFRKGNHPPNEMPIGSIRKTDDGYLLRKKSMHGSCWERWEFLHRAIWEEHYGPIPPGMVVIFKDSDRSNCSIDNLMMISKQENGAATMRGYRFTDPDLTVAGVRVAKLHLRMKELRKEKK